MEFVTVGYYICEPVQTPGFLKGIGSTCYSVSGCIGNQHPKLGACFWMGHEQEKEAYRRRWNMSMDTFRALERDVVELYSGYRIEVDSRFLRREDAEYMRRMYFGEPGCEVMCVSLKQEYRKMLKEEVEEQGQCRLPAVCGEQEGRQEVIGCDILGWDISGFHSFLCNSLHNGLNGVRFNEYGLLANPYEEVEAFAEEIQGKGEPVAWLPCRIGRCTAE